jgi:hypothetical protein
MEYLLVGDQMLWFGTQMPNSLLNPNQMRAYCIGVYEHDPFDTSRTTFGIDSDQAFIPFADTTGTVVHFESRVPTEWEKTHLPKILLTSEDWNPSQEVLRNGELSREYNEMRTIHHKKDHRAIPISDGTVQGANGQPKPKVTTR